MDHSLHGEMEAVKLEIPSRTASPAFPRCLRELSGTGSPSPTGLCATRGVAQAQPELTGSCC